MRAQNGLLPQTIRHTAIASLLGIPDIIVVVNKMDCCGYDRLRFVDLETEYRGKIRDFPFRSTVCLPASALRGDNVCRRSDSMPWYSGPTLLHMLENLTPPEKADRPFQMPVQWIARAHNFRGLAGTALSGSVRRGQAIAFSPSGLTGRVTRIVTHGGDLAEAGPGQAVCLQLADDLDIGRGELAVDPERRPATRDQFAARVVWLNDPHLVPGRTYLFRQGTAEARATITELSGRLNLNTLAKEPVRELHANDIGWIKVSLDRPLPIVPYAESADMGGFLLIDRMSGNTLGAGMVEFALHRSHTVFWQKFELDKAAHAAQKNQSPRLLWFTGLSASGKSTVANLAAGMLHARGRHVYILDGDNLRHGLCRDLGFTERDRAENIRRASEAGHLLVDAGLIVFACFISPYRADRMAVRDRFADGEFLEIFMDTPLDVCMARDPKGLYAKAKSGSLPNFTGISSPFETPERPDLRLDGTLPPEDLAQQVVAFLESREADAMKAGAQP